MTRLDVAVGIPDLTALVALTGASTPPRVDGGIYYVSNAGGLAQGRWAQYLAASAATVTDGEILMPADSVGRWHLALAASGGGGGGGGDADADAYIARLTGTYTDPELAAIDAFVVALKAQTITAGGSIWDALDGFWLRCADNEADSRLSLKGTSYGLTDGGTGATFTAREGWQLNGAAYFEAAIAATVNQHFGGVYVRAAGVTDDALMHYDNTNYENYLGIRTGNQLRGRIAGLVLNTLLAGVAGSASISATVDDVFVANDQDFENNGSPGTFPSSYDGKVIFGASYDSGYLEFATNQFAAAWVGITADKGLIGAELTAFHAAVETLMDAFGAGVVA